MVYCALQVQYVGERKEVVWKYSSIDEDLENFSLLFFFSCSHKKLHLPSWYECSILSVMMLQCNTVIDRVKLLE